MTMYRDSTDPFGAPEFFVTGVAGHEMAAPGLVRFTFDAQERDGAIVKVKLLIPASAIPHCMELTKAFLNDESLTGGIDPVVLRRLM